MCSRDATRHSIAASNIETACAMSGWARPVDAACVVMVRHPLRHSSLTLLRWGFLVYRGHHSLQGRANGHVSQHRGAASLSLRQVARKSHSSAKSRISAASLDESVAARRRAVSPRLAHRLARGIKILRDPRVARAAFKARPYRRGFRRRIDLSQLW